MSDGDDDDDNDELFGSSDSDSGTDAGTDSDTASLKGAAMEAQRERRIAEQKAMIDSLGMLDAVESLRKAKRTRRQREKGAEPSRRSERSTPAGAGPTTGDGDGEGHESATSKRRKTLADFPRQFGAFLKKFGFVRCDTARDGCCLLSSILGSIGVITAHQAKKPDTITAQYKRTLRSKAYESAKSVVDTWDETMPVWAFHRKSSQDAADAEAYRRKLRRELEQLKEPGAFNYDALEYFTWQLALEVGRPIVILNLQADGKLGTHFKLYACRDDQSHINVLQDLDRVLGLDSDRGPLVLVREGPTKASGHFTYLVNAHGPDIEAREREQFLFRLGALQPVDRGAVQTSGGGLPNLTQKRVRVESPPRLGSRTEGGCTPLSPAGDADGEDEEELQLQPPALRTLGIPRVSQPSATEPSREAVEAELCAKIAELTRALQQKSSQLRRVDNALIAAAEASDVQIAIGCAPLLCTVRRDPARVAAS
jgi:hypothetical protein